MADTSAVINLIATGYADAIIGAFPQKLVVVDVVRGELENGRRRGRQDLDRLNDLVGAGHVCVVQLGDDGNRYFEELVLGPAIATLDDGEAATIAYALERGGSALIDERKATNICGERFPKLCVGSTVDLLFVSEVRQQLGEASLGDALFNALQHARMQVFPQHLDEVMELIGSDRAGLCHSLPRRARDKR